MASPAPLDAARIVRTLDAHGVQAIVVGGIAANLHGAQRRTEDFDLVARQHPDNLRRLAAAMRELGAYIRTDGYLDDATIALSKSLAHEDHLAQMEVSTWNSDAGPFDVLANIPAATGDHLDYDTLAARAIEVVHPPTGVVVLVAHLDDIVASKEWAKRPKDLAALDELHALRDTQPPPPSPSRGMRSRLDPPDGHPGRTAGRGPER